MTINKLRCGRVSLSTQRQARRRIVDGHYLLDSVQNVHQRATQPVRPIDARVDIIEHLNISRIDPSGQPIGHLFEAQKIGRMESNCSSEVIDF